MLKNKKKNPANYTGFLETRLIDLIALLVVKFYV